MKNPLGLHVTTRFPGDDYNQPAGHGLYAWLDAIRPAAVVVNNAPEVAAHLAAKYPGTTFYLRIHVRADGAPTDDDSHRYETAEQTVARMIAKRDAYHVPDSVWWCFCNEPTCANIDDPVDGLDQREEEIADWQLLADYTIGVYREAAANGFRVCGFHAGVKSIPMGDVDVWNILGPVFEECAKLRHIIAIHPYSPGPSAERVIPTPQGDWHITAAWWTEEVERMIAAAPGIRILFSEIGSEPIAGIPGAGTWRDLGLSRAEYAGQLTRLWDTVFTPYAGNIVGACVFAWDGDPGSRWTRWNVRGSDDFRDALAAWSPAVGVTGLPGQGGDDGQDDGGGETKAPGPVWRRWVRALAAWLRRLADWLEGVTG